MDPEARDGFEALLSFPGAYTNLSGMLVVLLGIGGAAWAGAVAGGEWSWNTFRLALARGESRVRYVLVTFAAIAGLLQSKKSLGQLRGQVHRYAGIPVIATYHPAALLRNPNWKKPTWDDVRIARQLLDV